VDQWNILFIFGQNYYSVHVNSSVSVTFINAVAHFRISVAKKKKIYIYRVLTRCANVSYVRFEVFAAATMKKAVFWNMTPCRYCGNRRFGEMYRLHLQGRRICEWASSWRLSSYLLTLVPRLRIFLPWRRRRYGPPKRWFTQDLRCATSEKTAFFISYVVSHELASSRFFYIFCLFFEY
jgi:hypothetical protein